MTAVLALLVALDPIGLAHVWPRRRAVAPVAGAVLLAATLLADPALDALDLSPEGFWIAAAIVLLVPAFSRLGRGVTRDVAGPGAVLVCMAVATRDGTGITLVAVAVAVAATAITTTFVGGGRWVGVAERGVGAAMVVIALDLIRDGVIAV